MLRMLNEFSQPTVEIKQAPEFIDLEEVMFS